MTELRESGIPAQMTAAHVAVVRKMERFVAGGEGQVITLTAGVDDKHLREVQSLVSALASRELVVVKRGEIEDGLREAEIVQVSPVPMERQCGHALFEMLSRWLSAEPEEK